jgi:hypothetical protein
MLSNAEGKTKCKKEHYMKNKIKVFGIIFMVMIIGAFSGCEILSDAPPIITITGVGSAIDSTDSVILYVADSGSDFLIQHYTNIGGAEFDGDSITFNITSDIDSGSYCRYLIINERYDYFYTNGDSFAELGINLPPDSTISKLPKQYIAMGIEAKTVIPFDDFVFVE